MTSKQNLRINVLAAALLSISAGSAFAAESLQDVMKRRNLTQQDLLAEKQPSHAFVTPQHLGELVLFLCSEAGSQVRGAAWNIDGGWLAQ